MFPMPPTTNPVVNPIMFTNQDPTQPKTAMPTNMQSVLMSWRCSRTAHLPGPRRTSVRHGGLTNLRMYCRESSVCGDRNGAAKPCRYFGASHMQHSAGMWHLGHSFFAPVVMHPAPMSAAIASTTKLMPSAFIVASLRSRCVRPHAARMHPHPSPRNSILFTCCAASKPDIFLNYSIARLKKQ